VNNEDRDKGSYADYWNVKDDSGFIVNDGVHYAVLQYIVDGEVKTLDLTNTTGGTRYSFPTGSGCDQRNTIGSSFTPYEDDLLPITFRLCKASEVTVFIGPLWSGGSETRIRTIINRQALSAGSHTVYWDGLDDQGNIAHPPPGDALILGMWRYTLPNNAIYVTGQRPVISNISSEPNYFDPLSNTCLDNGDSVNVTYTLSEDVDIVELRVISVSTKNTVRVIKEFNVSAGENHIFWNGRNNDGDFVEEGDYQLALSATDGEGNTSLLTYVNLVRLSY
jgi:flagellar hook assembly protein FlgD